MSTPSNIIRPSIRRVWLFTGINVLLFICITCVAAVAQNVNVTATAGTPSASYTTLKGAFDAVNAGTHQGAITIDIALSTTEGATPAVLNSSGAGSAVYTSVLIRPSADGVTITGTTPTGRGVIELNGADNVTINGDNPNTGGTNRNLTITSDAVSTTTFTSVIRIALSTLITSGDNDVVKNCIITGSATGRNVAAATSQTGSEFTTYGILVGGGASTAAATTAPSAIASVTTTIGAGITATNFSADNNQIDACARGIAVQGAATTVANNLSVTNNVIGNPVGGNPTTVYARAMTLQGFDNATIAGNTVRNIEGWFNTQLMGISLGDISATGQNAVVERNNVTNIFNHNTGTFGAYGINVAAGNTNTVRNNFVSGVTGDMTGGAAFSTTFGLFGIRVGTGTGHKIYHNSVNMFGLRTGTAATSLLGAAFGIVATTQTGMDVRNNIFVNNLSGGTTSIAYVAVYLPSGGTSAMNLTLNNNDYFNSAAPTAQQGVGQAGTTAGTNFFTQANFDPSMTTPVTNFRAYTSTLSAAGTNDNATKKVDPQFLSATDLHIAPASPMVDMGANVGVGNDIDGQSRVPPPDIGADEPGGVTPVANDIAAVAIINPPPGSTRSTTTVITPQASFSNNGTAAQTNVPVRFKILDSSSAVVYNQTTTIPSLNPGQTVTASFPNVTLTPAGTYTTQAFAELPGDQNTANDMVAGTVIIINPLAGGTYTVGAGGNFTSLTNTGGIFEALNSAGASGNIVINITSDLTGETGNIALNELPGGQSVTIKPSGAARTITGSSTVGIIRLSDADNVTIDGSLSGGTATGIGGDPSLRNLTVQNTNTAATAGGVIIVGQSTNGAQNVTIKNVNVSGQDPAQTLIGIAIGSTTPGASPTVNNNNARVENCSVQKAILGIFYNGVSAANPNTGAVITRNDLSATGANRLKRGGIFFFFQNGIIVTENKIGGISTDESADAIGIIAGIQNITATATTAGGVTNALIARNQINGVVGTSATGFSAAGIAVAGDVGGANTIVNNMISGVTAPSTSPDLVAGIFVAGVVGSNTKLYHNSISMTGDRQAVVNQIGSYGVAISGSNPVVELKDNIFYTTQTSSGGGANAKSYALGMTSAAGAATNLDANYNDYFFGGANAAGFRTGSLDTTGTDFATLAAWQTATSKDANSLSVDPLFVSPTADLHLQMGSPMINVGTPVGVTTDIDGQTRDAMPDIGADEIVAAGTPGTLQFSAPAYSVAENVAGGLATITVTRTGGSAGLASVNYATANGTAFGGASCTAGVDYVATSGTLNWADADAAPKTFTVTICNDSLFENDETFNASLSGATGATLGAPATATVTITNDDSATAPNAGDVVISEFRLRGAGGPTDEFIELYNTTNAPLTIAAATGTGLGVAASDGTLRCSVPNGTVIPTRGHYLCVNSTGYSLAAYPAGNGTTATGDATYTTDIADNAGIAVFNTNLPANFTLANRLDAVGSTSEANTLYKEGTGYPALNTLLNPDYSFYRDLNNATGTPKDTNNNATDFLFADPQATDANAGSRLGAPGPENLSSPVQRNATIKSALIDPGCPGSSSGAGAAAFTGCARHRDTTPDGANNSTFGTLSIRRKFTNNTGQPVTRLRFRVVDITTFPPPAGTADLRLRTSAPYTANLTGGGTTPVAGLTLETPAAQPNGGGFNSSVSAATITLAAPLAAGNSINVHFLLGVQQTGSFRFFINIEGQTNPPTINSKSGWKHPEMQSTTQRPDPQ